MRGLATVAVFLLGVLGSSAGELPFTVCDGAPFVPSSVTLEPSPLHRGAEAHFQINGTTDHEMQGGTFKAEVFIVTHHVTFPVYTESKSLCERTACPINKGPVTFTYDKMLPKITPPGSYMVKIEAVDLNKTMEMCLEVDFKITKSAGEVTAEKEIVIDWGTLKLAWLGIKPRMWEGPDGTATDDDDDAALQNIETRVVY